MEKAKFLIIEDHPLMLEGYRTMLTEKMQHLNANSVEITYVKTCEEAYRLLTDINTHGFFDFAILDWSLPPYEERGISGGSGLVSLIRRHSPNIRIIVITSHIEAITLYDIAKNFRPDGLISKVDFFLDTVEAVFDTITSGYIYYSKTVEDQIKQITKMEMYLDNYNRQIIALLAKGIKTKSIPKYLPLSISAIDKRKAQLRDYFLLNKGGDEDILKAAKNHGLI